VPDPTRLVLATTNPGKVRELGDLLGPRFVVEARPDDLPETIEDGRSLLENATKKAVEVFVHTGVAALADDTGLFVEALGGAPGVKSARYAGPGRDDQANRVKLLDDLAGTSNRRAYFETVIAIVGLEAVGIKPAEVETGGKDPYEDPWEPGVRPLVPLVGRGRVQGRIVEVPRGENGFGYDPLFEPVEGDGRTFAEMSLEDKQVLSHRRRALAEVGRLLSPD